MFFFFCFFFKEDTNSDACDDNIISVFVCVYYDIIHGYYGLFLLAGPPKDFSHGLDKALSSCCAGRSKLPENKVATEKTKASGEVSA